MARDGEFQVVRFVHQPVQPAGAIEQRILGVQMEMDKIGMRHGSKLPLLESRVQARDVNNRKIRNSKLEIRKTKKNF